MSTSPYFQDRLVFVYDNVCSYLSGIDVFIFWFLPYIVHCIFISCLGTVASCLVIFIIIPSVHFARVQ